ncbi:septation ring formation regulator EzrA [Bacillus suaedae]|uniref:Septation ring formation regulator EzrA n=1 Tax=Halalkalibacter suaedae TaxID=2822140 RepID=A0A940WQ57_9BACI|nr:septation ring formation regulator EzrA [Bacillus suaedae]MBP3949778.1 septation ring formation regulator EzrA [Bacillus suaedae]
MNYFFLAFAIILILISASMILRKRTYKEVDRLEEWKNDILHRPIPDEIGKVKKLQMSGQTEEKFETWRTEWDDIVGVILPDIEEKLFDIEDFASKHRFSKAKQLLSVTENRLNGIEDQLTKMLADIQILIESEEYNRSEIDIVRHRFMELTETLSKKRASIGEGFPSFKNKVEDIEQMLQSYDASTNDGSYIEAREFLVQSNSQMGEVENLLETYPKLLVQIDMVIPADLKEIRRGIAEMEEDGYQLEAFSIPTQLESIEGNLASLREKVTNLQCEGVEERVSEQVDQLEKLYEVLEFEVESKQYVKVKHDQLEKLIQQGRDEVDALLAETLTIQESYLIPQKQLSAQKRMRNGVEELSGQLFVLTDLIEQDKQTFTSIRELVDEWQEQMKNLLDEIDEEKATLFAMREEEWKAQETLEYLRDKMLDTKRILKKSNIPGLPVAFIEKLNESEQKLIEAFQQLDQIPLELGQVNALVKEAVSMVEENNVQITELIHRVELTEKVIQYGNRYRSKSQKVNEQLNEAEQLFRQYEYEESLQCAVDAIKPFEPDVISIVEEYMPA